MAPGLTDTIGEAIKDLEAARLRLQRAAPLSGVTSLIDRTMGMAVCLYEQAEDAERDGQLVVRLDQTEPITPLMVQVLRGVRRGGYKMPRRNTKERAAWSECCRRGLIGQKGKTEFTLTKIGVLKLEEAERGE